MPDSTFDTHEVFNQSPVFGGHNVYTGDPLLKRVASALPAGVKGELEAHGKWPAAQKRLRWLASPTGLSLNSRPST